MRVSILIPAYNAETTIAQAIHSALHQTHQPCEVIVVDDGSTDHTADVVQGFPVRLIRQENRGAAAARNRALWFATGEYVQWLDADDVLAPDKIARQLAIGGDLLSGPWGSFLHHPDKATFTQTDLWSDLQPVEYLMLKMGRGLHMQPATWLVSRALTNRAGPWDESLSLDDDGEYFARVVAASDGIRFVPTARTYYRRGGSLSAIDGSHRKLDSLYRSMQRQIYVLLALEDSERTARACLDFIRTWAPQFHSSPLLADLRQAAHEFGGDLPRMDTRYRRVARTIRHRLRLALSHYRPLKGWG